MQKIGINIESVRKILPHGAIKELAKRSKTSIYTVSRVVNGTSNNVSVMSAIKDYITEIKILKQDINETADALNPAP